jgi:hypothetical protein
LTAVEGKRSTATVVLDDGGRRPAAVLFDDGGGNEQQLTAMEEDGVPGRLFNHGQLGLSLAFPPSFFSVD